MMGAAAQIGEQWLIPVLEAILAQFPFRIRGFHSDNESEFINHAVARLLNKLRAEQIKSRPRHPNENGLVESKNGAVIRKHIGIWLYRGESCRRHHAVIAITSIRISICMGPTTCRKHHRPERETTADLSSLRHALRTVAGDPSSRPF